MSNGILFILDGWDFIDIRWKQWWKPPVVMNQEPIFSWYRSQKKEHFFLLLYWTSDGVYSLNSICTKTGIWVVYPTPLHTITSLITTRDLIYCLCNLVLMQANQMNQIKEATMSFGCIIQSIVQVLKTLTSTDLLRWWAYNTKRPIMEWIWSTWKALWHHHMLLLLLSLGGVQSKFTFIKIQFHWFTRQSFHCHLGCCSTLCCHSQFCILKKTDLLSTGTNCLTKDSRTNCEGNCILGHNNCLA